MSNWSYPSFNKYKSDCDCKENSFKHFSLATKHCDECESSTKIIYMSVYGEKRKCYPFEGGG